MSQKVRVNRLLQLLDLNPDISLDELAARLGAHAQVIRRDLLGIRRGKD